MLLFCGSKIAALPFEDGRGGYSGTTRMLFRMLQSTLITGVERPKLFFLFEVSWICFFCVNFVSRNHTPYIV